ncbi:hypothetical protein BC827DRAFT_1270875 [Russula dissimulans]|nr:hypothetical protein BC827DRAFT_1270875 [Russula dissimulans]
MRFLFVRALLALKRRFDVVKRRGLQLRLSIVKRDTDVTEGEDPTNDRRDEDPPSVVARTMDQNNGDNGGPPDVKDPPMDQDDIRSNFEDLTENSDPKDNGGPPNKITMIADDNGMDDIEMKGCEKDEDEQNNVDEGREV